MTPPLTQRERQVLAELELCSHGTITNYNASGAHSTERDPRPTGESQPPHLTFRKRLLEAPGPVERGMILTDAQDELRDFRRRVAPPVETTETSAQLDQRICVKLGEGWTVSEIALACRVTPTRVRQAAASGKITKEDRSIQALAAQGHSVKYIAIRLGIPKSTVHDAIRRAA